MFTNILKNIGTVITKKGSFGLTEHEEAMVILGMLICFSIVVVEIVLLNFIAKKYGKRINVFFGKIIKKKENN